MCGILGIALNDNNNSGNSVQKKILEDLFKLSESRGKEASGLALLQNGDINVIKSPSPASVLSKSKEYRNLLSSISSDTSFSAIGHSRLVTNGSASLNENNQPALQENLICVHNGIITNDNKIFDKFRIEKSQLDTLALLKLINTFSEKHDLIEAIVKSYQVIEGSASCAFIEAGSNNITLATNNGSLYFIYDKDKKIFIFASEQIILKRIQKKYDILKKCTDIKKLQACNLISINLNDFSKTKASWNYDFNTTSGFWETQDLLCKELNTNQLNSKITDHSKSDFPDFNSIKRCKKCILPYTFPYIEFDSSGVCNYCNEYVPQGERGHKKIKEIIDPYKSLKNVHGQNCIIGLSGGRDSSYALHYVKEILGMNPVAFTYDWGLVTDLARRNIFKMCGQLGVEHILVSADIRKKRSNVRKNIEAWLKRPNLFMIPLFMAGDKQFYYHAHRLRKELDIKLFMFGAGNTLEKTDFKVGFANVRNNSAGGILTQLRSIDKFKLLAKYGTEFILNPSYLNSSMYDTLEGFYSSYLLRDDYTYLYHHIPWIEDEVEKVLKEKYDWEGATDTSTSWRVGDGTAAFYNYIYYTVAGFTEHDTFRSNQIRENMISREKALALVCEENQPRWDTLDWYAKTIGFNIDDALLKINKMQRLYK